MMGTVVIFLVDEFSHVGAFELGALNLSFDGDPSGSCQAI